MNRTNRTLAALAFATAAVTAPISYLVADDKPPTGIFNDKPDAEGFVSIFNGKDLTGWAGQEGYWDVKDGAISGHETKEKSRQTFLVFNQPVSNFELRYKFKFNAVDGKVEGNSGVQFRSKIKDAKKDPFVVAGYQADCDAANGFTGIIYDEAGGAGGRGIMSKRGEKTHYTADGDPKKPHTEKLPKSDKEIKDAIKVGDWNDCVLIADGNHITYQINGVTTTELIDESPKALKEGVLALQVHAGFTMDILFKDMKMKKFRQ
jgi:hypothetical protein